MSHHTSPLARARRVAIGLAGALAAIAWVAGPVDARIGGDHHSPAVVSTAFVALAAHDTFSTAGTPGSFVAYVTARDAAADAVAAEMRLDPLAVRAAWARADLTHQEAVLAALTQLGRPYRSTTSDPEVGFDCSGLTSWAWGRAGVALTRQSSAQINAAAPRDPTSAVAGDLVQYPGHVMMYLGVDGAIVHAANHRSDVELSFTSRSVRYGNPIG